ncbi:cell division protein DedD [Xenorhabdus hominickii]|uniref:Cell division protein DedD n=1 Tax=Xenorhabdus hominickii TaxID=351679 RepID=A0A2G0Q6J7_XENHO|nr:cell division protein DedD [Xenorhabdus hominickii]AOM39394.1 cell division protein DedD [Xenorhabdus hominickii]PHM54847.1 cell division protein DedD [Xenorhabdus hominickii]
MASKFQNRLVGTIVLVALGVIVLPVIFDGDKKYNEGQFASIPLLPKPGDEEDIDSLPPLTQNMPSTPPEGAAEAMTSQAHENEQLEILSNSFLPEPVIAPPPETNRPDPKEAAKPETVSPPKVAAKPAAKPATQPDTAPQGVAYVVQLGALKNANKVQEIVANLRLTGHQVYTVPSSPIQGQLTRIYVGPNASRETLESKLPELRETTGLQGQIKNYKP